MAAAKKATKKAASAASAASSAAASSSSTTSGMSMPWRKAATTPTEASAIPSNLAFRMRGSFPFAVF